MTKCRIYSVILCASLLLTSCSGESIKGSEKIDVEFESMEQEPILSYAVPSVQPHILVNHIGYEKDGIKTVIFVGEELSESFQIFDKESKEIVYTGTLKDKGCSKDGKEYYGYGEFTDFDIEGEYYIQCDTWGRSYPFEIRKNICEPLLENTISFFEENPLDKTINAAIPGNSGIVLTLQGGWITDQNYNQEVIISGKAFMSIIAAWDLYLDALNKRENPTTYPLVIEVMKSQAEWMLQLQDEKSGGVYGGVLANAKNNGIMEYKLIEISKESTAVFAANMAAFSYVYQEFDKEYADLCLMAADKAWNYLSKEQAILNSEGFCAATQLYRASGQKQYYNAIIAYLGSKEIISVENEWELFGGLTYLSTKMNVDVNICAQIMKEIMEQAEKISSDARSEVFLTKGNNELNNTDELLWNMVILGIADYVISNHEYATVIQNHNHFLLGRNQQALALINEERVDKLAEEDKIIDNNLLYNAYYLFMLSQIMKKE